MRTQRGGEGESGINREVGTDIHTLPCIKQTASGKLLYSSGSSAWCSVVIWSGGMGGGREAKEGGGIYTHTHI